jgi:uncharacterized phage infection (PIP) family protein YhgE
MMKRKISRSEFEELYEMLVENLTEHAYESIIGLIDKIEAMAEEGRLTRELVDQLKELLQSLNELLSSRDEMQKDGKELVNESLRDGFSLMADIADDEPDLIEDAVRVLTELYEAKELLDKIQRRIVSLIDALNSYDELLNAGIDEP